MSAVPSPAHVLAARTRKDRERAGRELVTMELAQEVRGVRVARKRVRFLNAQPALMLVKRAEAEAAAPPAPWISTHALVAIGVAIVIGLGLMVRAGFFDWRPTDRAVSTIDHRLAPHLKPMERTKP